MVEFVIPQRSVEFSIPLRSKKQLKGLGFFVLFFFCWIWGKCFIFAA